MRLAADDSPINMYLIMSNTSDVSLLVIINVLEEHLFK